MRYYDCHNRAPFKGHYVAFDGYADAARTQVKTVNVKHVTTTACQYKESRTDAQCAGCVHTNTDQ